MHLSFMSIQLSEFFDIALFAVVLYMGIVWLKSTKAGLMGLGIFILAAVYILARLLGLQLIAWMLQGFFAVFVVIIVVIFQEELRQAFERIALWSLGKKTPRAVESKAADVLVETLDDLAKDKIGALIVLPGAQPIDRHISGGIRLGGMLSEPLLKSIFDPHSAGHDGAVIVERGEIVRFAAHLPLSKDFSQLSRVGTRHSAALGLSELTDALCLVVSEERGVISVAQDGRLHQIRDTQELVSLLDGFMREKYPSKNARKITSHLLKENWVEKAVAIGVAVGLWFVFVPGAKVSEITYQVPVHVADLPVGFVVENIDPPEVRVVFSATRRSFFLFEPNQLEATVDASLAALGRRTFRILETDIRHPSGLSVKEISPEEVKLSLKKVVVPGSKRKR